MNLFSGSAELAPIPLEDGQLAFLEQIALSQSNQAVLQQLIADTAWRAETIVVWGKRHLQPRLIAWYGTASYGYSGVRLDPLPFTALQLEIKEAVQLASGLQFNSVLLNYYRDQNDSMGFHSDNESELGPDPAIASVSFGDPRTFILKHKRLHRTVKLSLGNGSLLLMAGSIQANWQHGINKERRFCGPRVNLTFRNIL